MKFTRQFTKNNDDAYSGLEFKTTTSEIKNPDGTIVFSAPNIEVPANYSQVAADIIAQKYFIFYYWPKVCAVWKEGSTKNCVFIKY